MKFLGYVALGLGLALAGQVNAKTFKLDISPSGETQTSRMENGQQEIFSHLPGSAVMLLEGSEPTKDFGVFRVFVLNATGSPLNFGPENVRLEYAAGKYMTMFTYAHLRRREEKKAAGARFAAALGGIGRSMQASQAGQYQGGGNVYSGYTGNRVGSFDYSGTNYGAQYAATQHAQAMNAAEQAAIDDHQQQRIGALGGFIQTTTVDPGKTFGGEIAFGYPKPMKSQRNAYPVTLEITVGADVHRISATLQHR